MFSYLPAAVSNNTDKKNKAVRELIKKNKISFLTHFTHIENLKSILQTGILPVSILKSNRAFGSVIFPSQPLPAAWSGFVSLNISFPDYKLFTQIQNHQPSDWVMLLVDPKIMLDFPCYFFPDRAINIINSAQNAGQILNDYRSSKDLKALFADLPDTKRKDLEIPQYYPTNPCSEILSFFPIAPSYIIQVYFCSEYKFNQWVLTNTEFALKQEKSRWACGLQFFSPRSDYTYWKTKRGSFNTEAL